MGELVAPTAAGLATATRALAAGLVVAYPTDTVYGLAADPQQGAALEQIWRMKGRPADRAVPLIAATVEQVEEGVGRMTVLARRLAARFWPGALTLVLAADAGLDRRLLGGRDSVAVRVPDHAVARRLAAEMGRAVTATSANRSGQAAAQSAPEAAAVFGAELALVLDGGPSRTGQPSTIVDARGVEPVLLRAGTVPWARVIQSLA